MKALQMSENIYWVGAIDWKLRNFHGYVTQRGSTYNAYLIIDKKITLIDTVKSYLSSEMLERIRSIIDPARIDYIISNHVEPDHSGSLLDVLKIATKAKVITLSPSGVKGLEAYYGQLPLQAVKSSDTLSLGLHTLKFIATPMIHWPDNMVSHCSPENILFSNDAFGQHLATTERFDDQTELVEVMHEAEKYYANIVQPYSSQVQRVMPQLSSLPIAMIAPSHGIIWRSHLTDILQKYNEWCHMTLSKSAIIVYDTMWGSTDKMAHAIADGFTDAGITPTLMDVQNNHISDIMTKVMSAAYIAVGSPTINNNILPTVGGFLTYFRGLNCAPRSYIAFGSYGWGGQSADIIAKELDACRLTALLPPQKQLFAPKMAELDRLRQTVTQSLQSQIL